MNTEKLRASIEALKEAGKRQHGTVTLMDGSGYECDELPRQDCLGNCGCGELKYNAAVDQAARLALAELGAQAARFDRLLAATKQAHSDLMSVTLRASPELSKDANEAMRRTALAIAEAEKP